MSTSEEDDPDTMSEAKLLAVPMFNVAPGNLSRLWARHSAILHEQEVDELALERAGDSARHLMISPESDPKERRRREEEEHRRAWLAYEETMREIRERSDRLLARIEERERIDLKRLREIEDNAITLHDGRRVYVDGDRYRDEQGRVLYGADADDARERHRDKPDAATWEERQTAKENCEADKRLKEKVLAEMEESKRDASNLNLVELERKRWEAEHRMSDDEKEFNDKLEAARADIAGKSGSELVASYTADYSDLYDSTSDRTTSYAKAEDGAGTIIAAAFSSAAQGQAGPDTQKAPRSSATFSPKVKA